jgi:hypothetical protein
VVRPEILGLRPDLGLMMTIMMGNRPDLSATQWGADNGCFAQPEKFTMAGYLRWLDIMAPFRRNCLFATAPDVLGDAVATLVRSAPALPIIREAGYRPALVAQDGLEDLMPDWDTFDVLFLGGSTNWKLSHAARDLTAEAKRRGKWVHMGRVNSLTRIRTAAMWGCDSADGTYLAFGPDKNLPKMLAWLDDLHSAPVLRFASGDS